MNTYLKIALIVFGLCGGSAFAQVGMTSNAPDKSAVLDIQSTSKGVLLPRVSLQSLTDVATIANPATGLLVYNTNAAISTGTGYYYYNSGWQKLIPVDNARDTLGNHVATKDLNMQGNKVYFKNADGIKVMLANSVDGPTISLLTGSWTTAFQTGYKGISPGEYVWINYGGPGNNTVFEQMRLTTQGYLGIGTSTPAAMLHVTGSAQIDTTLTIKNLPASGDSDLLLAANTNGTFVNSGIKIGNVPRRYSYSIPGVAPGASGTVTIVPEVAYKLVVYTGNSCGNNAVATFIVKDNYTLSCAGGQAYDATYAVTEAGTTGNSLMLTGNMTMACAADGADQHQFDFTLTINSDNTITIVNNNTSVSQTYTIKVSVI